MSLDALVWVLHNSRTRGSAKLVLLGLADHADADGGDAWPAVESLSAWAGIHERNVQRMLRYLEENGHIIREGEARTDPRYRPNAYRIVGVTPLVRKGPGAGRPRGDADATPPDSGVASGASRGGIARRLGVAPAPPEQSFNSPKPSARTRTFDNQRAAPPPDPEEWIEASLKGALARMDPEVRKLYEEGT